MNFEEPSHSETKGATSIDGDEVISRYSLIDEISRRKNIEDLPGLLKARESAFSTYKKVASFPNSLPPTNLFNEVLKDEIVHFEPVKKKMKPTQKRVAVQVSPEPVARSLPEFTSIPHFDFSKPHEHDLAYEMRSSLSVGDNLQSYNGEPVIHAMSHSREEAIMALKASYAPFSRRFSSIQKRVESIPGNGFDAHANVKTHATTTHVSASGDTVSTIANINASASFRAAPTKGCSATVTSEIVTSTSTSLADDECGSYTAERDERGKRKRTRSREMSSNVDKYFESSIYAESQQLNHANANANDNFVCIE